MDEEMDELKELAERTDRENEDFDRRRHHHGGRSRIHSFYPNDEREYGHSSYHHDQEMEHKEKHHRDFPYKTGYK